MINIPDKELSKSEYRSWISDIEDNLINIPGAYMLDGALRNGYKLEEAIVPGIYIRTFTMPKGSIVISKIHLQEHPYMIEKGKVSVYDGITTQTLIAPHRGITPIGTKRILYVIEDCTWITYHPIPDLSIEECNINGVLSCESFDEFEAITRGYDGNLESDNKVISMGVAI